MLTSKLVGGRKLKIGNPIGGTGLRISDLRFPISDRLDLHLYIYLNFNFDLRSQCGARRTTRQTTHGRGVLGVRRPVAITPVPAARDVEVEV